MKIDNVFEPVMVVMEHVLVLAFVFAVDLNLLNVIGRYGMGFSILRADEVQIYVMVCVTFLGASLFATLHERGQPRTPAFGCPGNGTKRRRAEL
jgi:TRAP-type C4-dicarboxylate transport system permease small subunit